MSDLSDQIDAGNEEQEDFSIAEYDLTATPNDFNVKTIVDFIEQGVFVIPDFQRSYVWDHRRASRLIESLLIGLPIPQVFLYQEGRNRYLVIDGQQRLMSIYFYVKGRFPRMEKRQALRRAMNQKGQTLAAILGDDDFFDGFTLQLPSAAASTPNRFHGAPYADLEDFKTTLDLRTVRCIVIKQNTPEGDTSVYEIFHRLNTGGVNLEPQEIRASLYHSRFFKLLDRINGDPRWRKILGTDEADLRMRDVEVLLRAFAMLLRAETYRPPMTRFLNGFSAEMKATPAEEIDRLEKLAGAFLDACHDLPPGVFGDARKTLKVSVFESVFAAVCRDAWSTAAPVHSIAADRVEALKSDPEFVDAANKRASNRPEVLRRLERARALLLEPMVRTA
jgi:hypothetical protein